MKIKYKANASEFGENFFFYFKTESNDKQIIADKAQEIAQGWGASCYSVEKAKDQSDIDTVFDADVKNVF